MKYFKASLFVYQRLVNVDVRKLANSLTRKLANSLALLSVVSVSSPSYDLGPTSRMLLIDSCKRLLPPSHPPWLCWLVIGSPGGQSETWQTVDALASHSGIGAHNCCGDFPQSDTCWDWRRRSIVIDLLILSIDFKSAWPPGHQLRTCFCLSSRSLSVLQGNWVFLSLSLSLSVNCP